jgi:murein DD-endopeptidase MepM/ murein hydrolase activator NlpD
MISQFKKSTLFSFSGVILLSALAYAAFAGMSLEQSDHNLDTSTAAQSLISEQKPVNVEQTNDGIQSESFLFPTEGRISSVFGWRLSRLTEQELHSGIDIANNEGTAVYAANNGTVEQAGFDKDYGKMIIIRHENNMKTLYAHLKNINVEEGQSVEHGDVIGSMGTTGKSVGVHLHFEIHVDGSPVDPMDYIKSP